MAHTNSASKFWFILQAAVWAICLIVVVLLFVKPEIGLHAFWDVLIPVAPALVALLVRPRRPPRSRRDPGPGHHTSPRTPRRSRHSGSQRNAKRPTSKRITNGPGSYKAGGFLQMAKYDHSSQPLFAEHGTSDP